MKLTQIAGLAGILAASGVLTFAITPFVRLFAKRTGAMDVPRGSRHLHRKPTPLLGGIALYITFSIFSLVFAGVNSRMCGLLLGCGIIVLTGAVDDYIDLPPLAKLAAQVAAALPAVLLGARIEFINLGGQYLKFGWLSVPITVLWMVALTNAVNLIDGLDGLACGVSGIGALSMLCVTVIQGDWLSAVLTAIVTGSCFGFLPFNLSEKRKVFLGDTGALFLGYVLSYISVNGLFKTQAVLAFVVPVLIFGLPIFDTGFAFFRRILQRKNPFHGDRGHLHYRLIDSGFSERQTVCILYAFSGILGVLAVVLSGLGILWAAAVAVVAFTCAAVFIGLRNRKKR